MKKIVRLTEKDINMLVKKIIRESSPGDGKKDYFPEYEGRTDIYADNAGVENKNNPEQNLTERRYRRLPNRRVNENLSDKKMDLKSDFNDIINHKHYSEIKPSDLVEVLEELLHYAKNDVFRSKKPNKGYITKDEVIKNFKKN
jgi:hypothetical protein